jgi:hypothetical protein
MGLLSGIGKTLGGIGGKLAGAVVGKVIPVPGLDDWVEDRLTPSTKPKTQNGATTATGATVPQQQFPVQPTYATAAVSDPVQTTGFTASWSFFVVLLLGGMLLGMMWRKKY